MDPRAIVAAIVIGLAGVLPGWAGNGSTNNTASQPQINASLRDELLRLGVDDQKYRAILQARVVESQSTNSKPPAENVALIKKQLELDHRNIKRLEEIIHQFGWPGKSLVGQEAASAAFMILQHAELHTQEKYVPLLREATKKGEANPDETAMLEDRILTREGKKQIYGTQLHSGRDTGGKLVLYPIENEPEVDKRRASIGLPPLSEYLKLFHLEYHPPTAK